MVFNIMCCLSICMCVHMWSLCHRRHRHLIELLGFNAVFGLSQVMTFQSPKSFSCMLLICTLIQSIEVSFYIISSRPVIPIRRVEHASHSNEVTFWV